MSFLQNISDLKNMSQEKILARYGQIEPPYNFITLLEDMGVNIVQTRNEKTADIDGKFFLYHENGKFNFYAHSIMPESLKNRLALVAVEFIIKNINHLFAMTQNDGYIVFPTNANMNEYQRGFAMPKRDVLNLIRDVKIKDKNATADNLIEAVSSVFETGIILSKQRLFDLNLVEKNHLYDFFR